MKRLTLLLVSLFVVTTLQAQIMCYEYEYSHTEYWISPKEEPRKEVSPNYRDHKMYWAIDRSMPQKAFFPAAADGGYRVENQIMDVSRARGYSPDRPYEWTYMGYSYTMSGNHEEISVGASGTGTRYYHKKRIFKAYDKATMIYEKAPRAPKFKSDSSRYKNFREWFMQEMPAQDSIGSVQSITIVIEKDGSVTVEDVKVGTPQNEQLAQQVARVLTRSPKWTPAYDKDGKTPLRYRATGRDFLLRKTTEGLKRERELATSRMKHWCNQWGVDAGIVCCQMHYTDIGGITLEKLGERIKTATRPVVVVAVEETCRPSLELMRDWNIVLKGYEGKYDFYLVLGLQGSNTLHNYSKAFRTAKSNPSILFIYNKYGMSEERVGYSREQGVQFITWFDQMMEQSSF